eukprot:SAG11_NODE_54_length_19571_cov_29.437786_2_plen_267_part_00
MKLIFLFLLPLALGMEPEAEPEAEPVAEPQPQTVSVEDVQILKLIKKQFDIKLAEKEAQVRRLTEVLGGPIRTIVGYDGGYWDECYEDVRQEFCDELEQAGIYDIDSVSLSTLRRYVPDIEGSVYYNLRAAHEHLTHGGGQASNMDLQRGSRYEAARKIQSVARGRAVRRAMKMDDEDAAAAPPAAADAEPEPEPEQEPHHVHAANLILQSEQWLYASEWDDRGEDDSEHTECTECGETSEDYDAFFTFCDDEYTRGSIPYTTQRN